METQDECSARPIRYTARVFLGEREREGDQYVNQNYVGQPRPTLIVLQVCWKGGYLEDLMEIRRLFVRKVKMSPAHLLQVGYAGYENRRMVSMDGMAYHSGRHWLLSGK